MHGQKIKKDMQICADYSNYPMRKDTIMYHESTKNYLKNIMMVLCGLMHVLVEQSVAILQQVILIRHMLNLCGILI